MSKILTKVFGGLLKRSGFQYNILPKSYFKEGGPKKFNYSLIKTTATYSPWLGDESFIKVYEKVKEYTLVEFYRVYELWALIDEVCKLEEKGDLLEVGVWRGGTCGILAKKLELLGSSQTLYAADTFTGVVKSSEFDVNYNDGEHADTSKTMVEKLLFQELRLNNVKLLEGIFPDDTQHLIPENTRFSFCHIDVDVYKSAEGILDWIWNRMVIGGMVVFDDYGAISCSGITEFVNRRKSENDRIFIYNANGHAIFVKIR